MILGLHLPVRAGYRAVLEAAAAHGVAAVQLLPYARHHDPSPSELAAFKTGRATLARVIIHSRFVPSLKDGVPGAGICLDTAHAHAAGYDMSTAEGMLKFLSRAHRLLGSVDAFHVNDTRAMLGTHLENHRHLGTGRLKEGLAVLLPRQEFADVPGILEPPRGDFAADAAALSLARRLSV